MLQQSQVYPNARVNVNGEDGHVLQSDGVLTYVSDDNGAVKVYASPWFMENANEYEAPQEPTTEATPQTPAPKYDAQTGEPLGPTEVSPPGHTGPPLGVNQPGAPLAENAGLGPSTEGHPGSQEGSL